MKIMIIMIKLMIMTLSAVILKALHSCVIMISFTFNCSTVSSNALSSFFNFRYLHNSKWWTSIWNVNIPPKVRVFVWRLCQEAIRTLTNLSKSKIIVDPNCFWCKVVCEFSSHALLV
ncbi:hypothetical protein ACOSQ2_005194 [Xanthoceras sorbifolium]